MTTFEKWWQAASSELTWEKSRREVAYHAWHAALETTRGNHTPAEAELLQRINNLVARLEGLEHSHPALADPDPCADGFCPVELFRPIDETEGSV